MNKIGDKTVSIRDKVVEYIEEGYGAEPERLWVEYPEYVVFRHAPKGSGKGKWFCLIANATYGQLGLDGNPDEVIFAAVVKCDPDLIMELIHEPGFSRGYHMNKRTWLTVALDGTVPESDIKKLVENSFDLTR